ncbi:MAG: permease-like cell division protein FtsX [Candidatus Saccharimonas sp.]
MSKKKDSARAFAQRKRYRRQWRTFVRMCRYGVSNFSRNAWLTVAATVVMAVTLLIVFVTFMAQNALSDTVVTVGKRIDRSIYLKSGTTEVQAKPIIDSLNSLSNVQSTKFISTEEAKNDFARENKTDDETLKAITDATNKLPATIRIELKDVNDTSQLVNFVNTNETLKQYIDTARQPAFMGERKSATDTIASWTQTAQKGGIAASIVFSAISFLIIFNTIRMAIFNRRDEIEMMKLIGADKSFIRGPFVVEAMVYGFIAALIATGVGVAALFSVADKLHSYGITIQPTIDMVTTYIGFVLLAMIALGAVIGVVSSLFATRRYLKI